MKIRYFKNIEELLCKDSGADSEPGYIGQTTFDLSVKNPNTPEEAPLCSPQAILAEMENLDAETHAILQFIKELL